MGLSGSIPINILSLLLLFVLSACPTPSIVPVDQDFIDSVQNAKKDGGASDGSGDGTTTTDAGTADGGADGMATDAGATEGTGDGTTTDAGIADGGADGGHVPECPEMEFCTMELSVPIQGYARACSGFGPFDCYVDACGEMDKYCASVETAPGAWGYRCVILCGEKITSDAGTSDGSESEDAGSAVGNPCESNPCDPDAVCENIGNSFTCTCENTTWGDGITCDGWGGPCAPNEYISDAPTATADRECTNLTECLEDQYDILGVLADGTATADRECTNLTECAPGEFVEMAPTASSDRICGDCTLDLDYSTDINAANCTLLSDACDTATSYESIAAMVTNDRVCSALTMCHANATASTPATDTSDRVCACNNGYEGDGATNNASNAGGGQFLQASEFGSTATESITISSNDAQDATDPLYLTDAFTVDFWFKLDDTSGTTAESLVINPPNAAYSFMIMYAAQGYDLDDSGGTPTSADRGLYVTLSTHGFGQGASNEYTKGLISTPDLAANVWHHFAVTRDSSDGVKVYVNGEQKSFLGTADTETNQMVAPYSVVQNPQPTVTGSILLHGTGLGAQFLDGETLYLPGLSNGSIDEFRVIKGTAIDFAGSIPTAAHTCESGGGGSEVLFHLDGDLTESCSTGVVSATASSGVAWTHDGTGCVDINECHTDHGGCDANATCTNEPTPGDAPSCACNSGYEGDGTACADINECATDNGGCDPNATCTNGTSPGDAPNCTCNAGYEGDGGQFLQAGQLGVGTTEIITISSNNTNCPSNPLCLPGDFTMDFWINFADTAPASVVLHSGPPTSLPDSTGGGFALVRSGSSDSFDLGANVWSFVANGPGGHMLFSDSTPLTAGRWYHMALTRDSTGLIRMFQDGVSLTPSGEPNPPSNGVEPFNNTSIILGGDPMSMSLVQNFSLDEFRFVKGTAVDFTGSTPTAAHTCEGGGDGSEVLFHLDGDVTESCSTGVVSATASSGVAWTSDGTGCSDTNECIDETHNCPSSSTCINTFGAYACECTTGYDGANCDNDINECHAEDYPCDGNAACENTVGSFTCNCNEGYTGNGGTCTDIDECGLNTDGCQQVCTNTVPGYVCTCEGGYTLNADDHTCDTDDGCTDNEYYDPESGACESTTCNPTYEYCYCNTYASCPNAVDYLINVDFARQEKTQAKKGPAKVCMAEGDYWNAITQANTVSEAAPVTLKNALAENTAVTLLNHQLNNTIFSSCLSGDVMYADFMSGYSAEPALVTLGDLPGGIWDIYVYTTAGSTTISDTYSFKGSFSIVIQEIVESNESPPPPIFVSATQTMELENGDTVASEEGAGWVQGTNYLLFEDILVPHNYATSVVMEKMDFTELAPLIAGMQLVLKEANDDNDVDGDGHEDDEDLCPVHATTDNEPDACAEDFLECPFDLECSLQLGTEIVGLSHACAPYGTSCTNVPGSCPEGQTCGHIQVNGTEWGYFCVYLCEPSNLAGECPENESCDVPIAIQEGYDHICSGHGTTECTGDHSCSDGRVCKPVAIGEDTGNRCVHFCSNTGCPNENMQSPDCSTCLEQFTGPTCEYERFIDVGVGDGFACGVRADGRIKCVGASIDYIQQDLANTKDGDNTNFSNDDNYVQIDCDDNTCCAVRYAPPSNDSQGDSVYSIECFTNVNNETSITSAFASVGADEMILDIRLNGDINAYYLTKDAQNEQSMSYFGDDNSPSTPDETSVDLIGLIDTSVTNTCAVTSSAEELVCWGSFMDGVASDSWDSGSAPGNFYNTHSISEMAVGDLRVCIVSAASGETDQITRCWGGTGTALDQNIFSFELLTHIKMRGQMLCGSEENNADRIACVDLSALSNTQWHLPFDALTGAQVEMSEVDICLIGYEGKVTCKTIEGPAASWQTGYWMQ